MSDGGQTAPAKQVRKPKVKVSAAQQRLEEKLAQAEERRASVAAELDASQDVLVRARAFTRKYDGITVERAESQSFWNDLLEVFGINRRAVGAEFERPARRTDTGGMGRIDLLWPGILLAEHKSAGKDFTAALAQADAYELPEAEQPRLTVVCDFVRLFVRDNHTGRSTEFALTELPGRLGWFGPLVHNELEDLAPQRPVDVRAAVKMAELHDALLGAGYTGHKLRVLMTRILFCCFADDAGIWPRGRFDAYLRSVPPKFAGAALAQLFDVLNTAPVDRPGLLDDALRAFPYVNGGLFAEPLPISTFSAQLVDVLVATSEEVDWSAVSPAVFGAMFQGVMDNVERHELGAHYTSEENILRLIEPLFLDQLLTEIENAASVPALEKIWARMEAMRFLDPAAGCGNFLVVAYRELRRTERHLMRRLKALAAGDPRAQARHPWVTGQRYLDSSAASRLGVGQFFGIEIDEWPAQIAQVAMWLADHLANLELEEEFGGHQTRLPLVDTAHITVGNALRLDWNEVVGGQELSFVFGNPPFMGSNLQSGEQREDTAVVWGKTPGAGSLDYVTNWYHRVASIIDGTAIRAGLVATNSITQGEQPAVLWAHLRKFDMHIDFAHRTFRWTNEAPGRAAVHVVILGFSQGTKPGRKPLWEYPDVAGDGVRTDVTNINPYLVADANETLVTNRRRSLSPGVPPMVYGSMPNEGGHLILSPEEAAELREHDPIAAEYLRELLGAREMLPGKQRWCLWLVGAPLGDLRGSNELRRRVEAVRAQRGASTRETTRKLATTPSLFGEIRQPTTQYLAVPRHSSEHRPLVPMALYGPEVIAMDALMVIPGADMYAFGVLQSRAFALWNVTVSGRLKSDLRISAEVTYNNFPWPADQATGRDAVASAAAAVLAERAAVPGASLADLYDPLSMPPGLVKAHRDLDRAVLAQYGCKPSASDQHLLATLFARYSELLEAAD